ncbi:MAG: DUF2130 domain-containing protein [Emcibacteraceae bacterium]|nr:DUF2130 domain-containing protein [Emcibacteraceae bacterium]
MSKTAMDKNILIDVSTSINCPHCSQEYPLAEGISHQAIEKFTRNMEMTINAQRDAIEKELIETVLSEAKDNHEEELSELSKALEEKDLEAIRLQKQVELEKDKAIKGLSNEMEILEVELEDKKSLIDSLQKNEINLRKKARELKEREESLEFSAQRRIDEQVDEIKSSMVEKYSLKETEWKKKLQDLEKSTEELERKISQGSQQLQGEVQEIELESLLNQKFPIDQIDEIKKGARGADVLQSVKTMNGATAGKILWESKRTERWSSAWISKLKDDLQEANAEIPVLVTTEFPRGVESVCTQYEGVWITKPKYANSLAEALRLVLIESHRNKISSIGKNEKIEALYDYVCSTQFAQKVRAIVDSYVAMNTDLESEKRAMQKIWKKRQGQIERIATGITGMCGELEGLSTAELPELKSISTLEKITED